LGDQINADAQRGCRATFDQVANRSYHLVDLGLVGKVRVHRGTRSDPVQPKSYVRARYDLSDVHNPVLIAITTA
jgi:hypothetical protein